MSFVTSEDGVWSLGGWEIVEDGKDFLLRYVGIIVEMSMTLDDLRQLHELLGSMLTE